MLEEMSQLNGPGKMALSNIKSALDGGCRAGVGGRGRAGEEVFAEA